MCVTVLSCLENTVYHRHLLSMALAIFFGLLIFYGPKGKGCDIVAPFRADYSTDSYSLNIDQFWVFVSIAC